MTTVRLTTKSQLIYVTAFIAAAATLNLWYFLVILGMLLHNVFVIFLWTGKSHDRFENSIWFWTIGTVFILLSLSLPASAIILAFQYMS